MGFIERFPEDFLIDSHRFYYTFSHQGSRPALFETVYVDSFGGGSLGFRKNFINLKTARIKAVSAMSIFVFDSLDMIAYSSFMGSLTHFDIG